MASKLVASSGGGGRLSAPRKDTSFLRTTGGEGVGEGGGGGNFSDSASS